MGKARKTRAMREQERRRSRRNRMLFAGGSAVLLVVALVVVQQLTSSGSSRPDASNLKGVADVQTEFAGLTERAGTIGNPSAKVTITEFGDLRCPICKTFDNEVAPPGHLRHRAPGHGQADLQDVADPRPELGRRGQGRLRGPPAERLWRYAALTYLNQGDENVEWFTPAVARAIGRGVGLDMARFEKDRASAAATKAIGQVTSEATSPGFQGTPDDPRRGPKGTITVDATYDAIADRRPAGERQQRG